MTDLERFFYRPAGNYATQILAVTDAEARKLVHDPLELLSRAVQPVLWLMCSAK